MELLQPLSLGPRTAPNRVLFGPHVTNLGDDDRGLTERHVAYYLRRARGGCGTLVVEGASVHDSDWPYERAPLAERCAEGWAAIVAACRPEGALVVASLDHAGGQGSSAYSQAPLWAPSRVPEVNSREVPKWMEPDEIAAVVEGFAAAAELAVEAGCDGVEVNAGQHSLVRQFLSGLTNHRDDEWADRLLFARQVLAAVRGVLGPTHVLGLRLSCDELAPWAGLTPEMAPGVASELTHTGIDYVVVTRGAIFSAEKTRPDFHEAQGFNTDVCAAVKAELAGWATVVLQGSVVDPALAEQAIAGGVADAVEMTRAQIADPDLVAKVAAGAVGQVRPCILCNQACQVRDARNPIVSCVGEPSSGHEQEDPDWTSPTTRPRDVVVVGGGPAGMETARVAALRGHRVRLVERDATLGGLARHGPGEPLVRWLAAECERLGVDVELLGTPGVVASPETVVVQATGSRRGEPSYALDEDVSPAQVIDVADLRRGESALPPAGTIVVVDPIGGPIAVALAEQLGARAVLVTPDHVAGNELSRSGDLAPANVRLARLGVAVERRSIVRRVRRQGDGLAVEVEDRFAGTIRSIECAAVVDCGFRLPDTALADADLQAGDCVAPRTYLEAILDGRRAALAVDGV
ncbi:MAG: mycofactocin system FadH/OYE family oxidoreductase 1 [Actinomycetota bacterium]|nr:MAG: mycofactocin system FadH/OYE family oxidoreductase 1 [Actinomycetota bacterium]